MDKWQSAGLAAWQKLNRAGRWVKTSAVNQSRYFKLAPNASRLIQLLVVILALTANNSHALVTDLHDFTIADRGPGPMILVSNTFYGVSPNGNTEINVTSDGTGTIWKINKNGTGFMQLYSFSADPEGPNSDGAYIFAGVTLSDNTLYGAAFNGGASGVGTVFSLNTDGTGFLNLHNFSGADGSHPRGSLVLAGDTLYGITYGGGYGNSGTVFKIHADGTGFADLHLFTSLGDFNTNLDGVNPASGLILSSNVLYGTTVGGGMGGDPYLQGHGTVFRINTDGTGFQVLHAFPGLTGYGVYPGPYIFTNSDGANPSQKLLVSGNTLYGAASDGGVYGMGTLFSVNIDGTGFTKLCDFSGDFGDAHDLILSSNMIYGTCYSDITGGAVFRINTDGTGFTVLADIASGWSFDEGLVLSGQTFYGTSSSGTNGLGEIFSLSNYQLITLDSDQTNYTFASGWTYYVTAPVTLYGTTTIQGGSVIKYSGYGITISGTNLICATSPTNPAVFTVKDDDSVGVIIPGSSGSPSDYGGPLNLRGEGGTVFNLSNLSFAYQGQAIGFDGYDLMWLGNSLVLFNVQATNCWSFIQGGGVSIDFQNCLFANIDTVLPCTDTSATAENTTLDNCDFFSAPNDGGGSSLVLVNCLLANVPGISSFEYPFSEISDYETYNTAVLTSDSGVFQTATNGNFYLATDSPYRDAGTTAIDAGLLSELQAMTTYAPQDGGYADTNPPDVGYHYPRQ